MAESGQSREALQDTDARIAWVLSHPGMSGWLKDALRNALDQDPFDVLNDMEILRHLSAARCQDAMSAYQLDCNHEVIERVRNE